MYNSSLSSGNLHTFDLIKRKKNHMHFVEVVFQLLSISFSCIVSFAIISMLLSKLVSKLYYETESVNCS